MYFNKTDFTDCQGNVIYEQKKTTTTIGTQMKTLVQLKVQISVMPRGKCWTAKK